jgi:MFS family permease
MFIELYIFRFFEGAAAAACVICMYAMLMVIFPTKSASIAAYAEACFGLGFTLGKRKL